MFLVGSKGVPNTGGGLGKTAGFFSMKQIRDINLNLLKH